MNASWRLVGLVVAAVTLALGWVYADRKERWDSSAALGFNLTAGNSDTVLFTLQVQTEREWEKDLWRLGATASYGENDGDKSTERAGAFAEYQRLLTERLYAGLKLEVARDAIADVEYRATISPALGYYFIKSERTQLSGEIGPSFVLEKTGDGTKEYVALRLGERFEHKFNDRAKMWQTAEIFPQVDDVENFIARAELGTEAALNSKLSIRVVVKDEYDNQPAAGRKSNDVAVISSLVYKF
jgi:putative salt-induced outer membrane protein